MTKAHALKLYYKNVYNLELEGMSTVSVLKDMFKKKYDMDVEGNSFVSILQNAMGEDEDDGGDNLKLYLPFGSEGSDFATVEEVYAYCTENYNSTTKAFDGLDIYWVGVGDDPLTNWRANENYFSWFQENGSLICYIYPTTIQCLDDSD